MSAFCFALLPICQVCITQELELESLVRCQITDGLSGNCCSLRHVVIVQLCWLINCIISFKNAFFPSATETSSSFTCTLFLKPLCMENSPMRSLGSV